MLNLCMPLLQDPSIIAEPKYYNTIITSYAYTSGQDIFCYNPMTGRVRIRHYGTYEYFSWYKLEYQTKLQYENGKIKSYYGNINPGVLNPPSTNGRGAYLPQEFYLNKISEEGMFDWTRWVLDQYRVPGSKNGDGKGVWIVKTPGTLLRHSKNTTGVYWNTEYQDYALNFFEGIVLERDLDYYDLCIMMNDIGATYHHTVNITFKFI